MTPLNIKTARDSLGLTAAQFAEKLGYADANQVYRMERGKRGLNKWAQKQLDKMLKMHMKKSAK